MNAPEPPVGLVAERIAELLPFAEVLGDSDSSGLVVTLPAAHLEESMRCLRDDQALGFAVLLDLCAIDRSPGDPRFQLVYHLVAPESGRGLYVVVDVAGDGVGIPSLSGLWPAANWLEREAYDLFGLVFEGHPDLSRILLDAGFEGHPLRKDFVAQSRADKGEAH